MAFAGEPKKSRLIRLIFLEGPQPEGTLSSWGKPSLRPQGARVFARLPCPREEGALEKESDRGRNRRQRSMSRADYAKVGDRSGHLRARGIDSVQRMIGGAGTTDDLCVVADSGLK